MKLIFTLILSSISFMCFSQEKIDYSKDFEEKVLAPNNLVQNQKFEKLVKSSDLSDGWNMTKEFGGKDRQDWNIYSHQGIFGNEYYRIDFFINDVQKSESNPLKYLIKGKTRLKGNICDFQGEIEIVEIRMLEGTGTSMMHSHEFSDTLYLGVIVANYKFYENKNQLGSGVFEGKFGSGIFIYPNHLNFSQIGSWDEIDETDLQGTFVGTWKNYNSDKIKKCIWNYYTNNYPYSGDFHEISDSEKEIREKEIKTIETPLTPDQLFGKGINSKYLKNGWNLPPEEYNKDWWK